MRSVVVVCAALAALGCTKRSASDAPVDAAPVTSASAVSEPVDAGIDAESYGTRLRKAATLTDAIAFCRPEMKDGVYGRDAGNETGRACLAVWSSLRMQWSDVGVSKNETSFGMVMKDTPAALGKRLCIDVRVDLIEVMSEASERAGKLFGAFMRSNDGHFMGQAVKSTGEIVNGSGARFCGVVAGRGRGIDAHTAAPADEVYLVGMFDLPENRADGDAAR